eukprot:gnl/TRDRNA2_/TRDRNA2_200998_c0_seq1.p1 gnl/TRDRNA2_/TRDRNA2_200998_c0~~gnl/TRDRNA2_/TRDRNA2_200998_c0_seq1.p1  ORF type:complete len:212 (+),score=12.20 gnl/TRDRNA2_/TRDRNA2_200998_c0_seq1:143-778(+)
MPNGTVVQSSMPCARPGDLVCFAGPSIGYAMGRWLPQPFLPEVCDCLSDVEKLVGSGAFADQLRRLSAPMSQAVGWVPACTAAAFVTVVPCVVVTLLLDTYVSAGVAIVGFIACVFGPIFAAVAAQHKSASTVSEAVKQMETVVDQINKELGPKGLQWEHWEHVEYRDTTVRDTPAKAESMRLHCWSLVSSTTPIEPIGAGEFESVVNSTS